MTGRATAALDFTVMQDGQEVPILAANTVGAYFAEHASDAELCEYFVAVEWLHTVPIAQAVKELGMFGNQNTVCRPTASKWRWTIERLKTRFENFDKS